MPKIPKIETLTGDASLELPEFAVPPENPIGLLEKWVADAVERGVSEPLALVLATAGQDATPSTRVVLIKEIDSTGVIFGTDRESRKGRELAESETAAGTLYWRETMQQVNLAGTIEELSPGDSNALFADRAELSRASAIASSQSENMEDEVELRQSAVELMGSGDLDRPDTWAGYRLKIERIEFWHGSRDRIHRRLEYSLTPEGWSSRRLQP